MNANVNIRLNYIRDLYRKHAGLYPSISSNNEVNVDYNFVELFNKVANILSEDEALIYENEYLSIPKVNWWMNYFSQSTYYRHRKSMLIKIHKYLLPHIDINESE